MQPQALCAAVLLAGLCAETCGEPSRWQARVTREDARDGDVTPQTAASNHTNNWAVLVCTSRFWFNYRHMANTLSFYHTVKRLGIPDSNIILMLADDIACNARNSHPSAVYNNKDKGLNLYGSLVEVDYRGYEVTVENFIRVLTGRHDHAVPLSKRLMSDSTSNVLLFLTGHGGDEFMKFQDDEELGAQDLADALGQMHKKGRYNELMLIVETCEASTMWRRVYSPEILGLASSKLGEKSYSHHSSSALGVSVIDRFTFHLLSFMEHHVPGIHSKAPVQELYDFVRTKPLHSTAIMRNNNFSRPLSAVQVVDFLGSKHRAQPVTKIHPFRGLQTGHLREMPDGTHGIATSNSMQRITGGAQLNRIDSARGCLHPDSLHHLWRIAGFCCLIVIGSGLLLQPRLFTDYTPPRCARIPT